MFERADKEKPWNRILLFLFFLFALINFHFLIAMHLHNSLSLNIFKLLTNKNQDFVLVSTGIKTIASQWREIFFDDIKGPKKKGKKKTLQFLLRLYLLRNVSFFPSTFYLDYLLTNKREKGRQKRGWREPRLSGGS